MTLSTLFAQGQIRLSEISVFNWGSFHQLHTARIDPEGTLITGDNGAGKSTFIDGLMALLQPPNKANFNVAAAQGARSDRSLVSYMRGSFGSEHDGSGTRVKSKREKAVTTALRALYTADDGSMISLIGLFWLGQGKNSVSEVNRLYMIASRNVELGEVLEIFADGNTRQLKQHFNPKQDLRIHYFDSKFEDYQDMYRKYLFMDNPNAPALLSRALGLKKIDDLTKLIRELVLEPSQIRSQVQDAVNEFKDLDANYKHLADTREQVSHLQRLPDLAAQLADLTENLSRLQLEKHSLSAYMGELYAQFWADKVAMLKQEISTIRMQFNQIELKEQDAEQKQERCHEDYLQLGGHLIESLQKELDNIQSRLKQLTRDASRYQEDARKLRLPEDLTEQHLLQNQCDAQTKLQDIAQETAQRQDAFAEVSTLYGLTQQQLKDVDNDIQEIEARPDSNINDVHLLRLRDELKAQLDFDEQELMFIGELIDVKDTEKHWQGAIERSLGGIKTTLLVPQDRYSMVTKWVNARNNKTHVRLQVVNLKQTTATHFKQDGFLRKLLWREHLYRDWLKQHLNRFDLQCVENTQILDITPFSMTQQGLIHREQGRFEKKDQQRIDDRKVWCLGFSNTSRLSLLKHDLAQLKEELKKHSLIIGQARQLLNDITQDKNIWERILTYQWDEINVPYWLDRSQKTGEELTHLQESDSDAAKAQQRWELAKDELKAIQKDKGQLLQNEGQLLEKLSSVELKKQKAQQEADQGVSESARQLLSLRIGTSPELTETLIADVEKALSREIDQISGQKSTAGNTAIGIMGAFRGKDRWAHIPLQREWANGLTALEDYTAYYHELEHEGLPALVEQFEQRLQKHTTQSLSVIQDKLYASKEEIIDRIVLINQVLQRTEFKAGSYLRLGYKKERYPHVIDFDNKLKQAVASVNDAEYERRFKLMAEVMSILEKASSSATAQNMESLRLLDPRYQMSFHAEEVDAQTGQILDVLESSSGKSGGEKESFAGIIVAASLAYVLTPDGYDYPIYCTVFLDEAFSNTAEAVSRRVLKVFKELKIHVNLITPYKNLNLARESARSLLIAERNTEEHESHLCEVTWQEIDEKMAEKEKNMFLEAEELGVLING